MTLPPLRRAALLALTAAFTLSQGAAQDTATPSPVTPAPATLAPTAPVATPSTPVAAPTATPTTSNTLPAGPLPGSGVRGLWVDAFGPGLKTRAQVEKTVQDAAALGINALFVQAIRRADCLCLKSGLPKVSDADLEPGFDPLEAVTRAAHARGIRVIAWASVTGFVNLNSPNRSAQHIARTHGPDSGAASWVTRRPDGSWADAGREGWIDLAIPEAAEYMAQAVVNLVRNYAVDGIQLDRIRYPDGGVWGYDPKVLARYRAETGRAGTPAPADPAWQDWKRQQVTAFVRRVALEVKTVRPAAWVTAATITYQTPPRAYDLVTFRRTRTYADVLQDWPTWMQSGLLDLNVLMNYKRDGAGDQAAWYDGWNTFAQTMRTRADGGAAGLAAGTALYLNSPQVTAAQASRAVAAGLGWVGYSYRSPTADVYYGRESTARGLDDLKPVVAALGTPLPGAAGRWTEAPPTLRGLLGRVTGTPVPGGRVVEAVQNGQVVAQALTDGGGYYGFAALPAGPVEVRVSGQRWAAVIPARGVVRLPDLFVRDLTPVAAPARTAPVSPVPIQPTPTQP